MRKSLLCSVLGLFLAFSSAHAENRYGVLAGLNFSKPRVSTDADSGSADTSTVFMPGLFAQWQIQDGLYFEPQLRYNKVSGTIGADISLSYLEIPLYAKYKFALGLPVVPVVFAGPTVGFRVGADVGGLSGGAVGDQFKSINVTADLGVGGEYALNEQLALGLSASYAFGLTELTDGLLAQQLNGTSFKSRGLQLYLGLSSAF